MTDNRTTELRISEPLRGFIRHQSNRAYIDGGQARWLTKIADEIDAKHEQAIAATLGTRTAGVTKKVEELRTASLKFPPPIRRKVNIALDGIEQAIAATLGDGDYKQAADYWKGMYEELLTERIGDESDYPEHDGRYECPDCGNVVYYDELYGGGWTIYVEDYQIPFNACPSCGKAVKR